MRSNTQTGLAPLAFKCVIITLMKIVILEGIATSGKSTITKVLKRKLQEQGKSVLAVTEEETLMPILDDTSTKTNLYRCKELLKKYLNKKSDYIIFDRFYFSHIFRSDSAKASFAEILSSLQTEDVLAVLLTIPEDKISDRIFSSTAHRDPSWEDFIMKKGETREEIAKYYIEQQNIFLSLFNATELRHITIDSSKNNYDELADIILYNGQYQGI